LFYFHFQRVIINEFKNIHFTENTEVIKGPEKVDEFLLSLFKALDRQKSKDDRKSVEKKVGFFFML
jgi:hypothetical protein